VGKKSLGASFRITCMCSLVGMARLLTIKTEKVVTRVFISTNKLLLPGNPNGKTVKSRKKVKKKRLTGGLFIVSLSEKIYFAVPKSHTFFRYRRYGPSRVSWTHFSPNFLPLPCIQDILLHSCYENLVRLV
jgi:ribosomal protein L24E